jgi:hypothetical protein
MNLQNMSDQFRNESSGIDSPYEDQLQDGSNGLNDDWYPLITG